MFLIFGFKSREKRLGAPVGVCPVCGNTAAQVIVRRSTWFSLFFVPLFPVKPASHYATCTFCGTSRRAEAHELAAR